MNNLLQRRMQNQRLMQQGQNMMNQQNQTWYNLGKSVGNAFFPNMVNGTQDGTYKGTDMSKMDGYDKKLTDQENFNNIFLQRGGAGDAIGQEMAWSNKDNSMFNIANSGDNFVSADGNGDTNIDALGALSSGIFNGNNSAFNQGMNNLGYVSSSNWRDKLNKGWY